MTADRADRPGGIEGKDAEPHQEASDTGIAEDDPVCDFLLGDEIGRRLRVQMHLPRSLQRGVCVCGRERVRMCERTDYVGSTAKQPIQARRESSDEPRAVACQSQPQRMSLTPKTSASWSMCPVGIGTYSKRPPWRISFSENGAHFSGYALVSRFGSSHHSAAHSFANFGIEGH